MATSVQTRDVVWCDGVTVSGQDFRLAQLSALLSGTGAAAGNQLGAQGGVRDAPGSPYAVSVATGLSVTVNPGFAQVPGTVAANAGAYSVTLDTSAVLTCQTADLANSRIDLVCLTVTDNGDASSAAVVQVVTGTPAPAPSAPALPPTSIPLAQVTVRANATALSSGNIADARLYSAASGGIMPVRSSAAYPAAAGVAGYVHNVASGRLLRALGGGNVAAPAVALFAPVITSGSAEATNGTYQTIASASVTADGSTTVKCSLKWTSIGTSGTAVGDSCTIRLLRDGATMVDSIVKYAAVVNAHIDGGSVMIPDVPASGTHTYAWQIAVTGGAGTFTLHVGTMLVEAVSP